MTNNSNLYFPMSPSSSSSPLLLPPNPQKLRKKRSKMIPKPQHCTIKKPKLPYPHLSQLRHSCPECFKQFTSEKALYGHMRCHPDRDYRGMIRKPNHQNSISFNSCSLIQQQKELSPVISSEDHEVASCLLLLSRTDNGEGSGCIFDCSSCKKVFGSHQALRGHRASHKNVRGCFANNRSCDECEEMAMANLGHKCGICFRVFSAGQALGGNMRCHWEKGDDGHDFDYDLNKFGLVDLNLPADHSSDFNLDLRLGL